MNRARIASCVLFLTAATAQAQSRGVERLNALVSGLTVTPRVLLIGAHPTDADEDLIAWLAHGHHVETGYLSLTRGESAPNYTGLESGAALGAVHVQEMMAARRIDGGEQFFTRAYDFGAARTGDEAFEQWDHTVMLGEVVTVVRAFRPQVIIALARPDSMDHDGQRQAAAMLAREVFDAAADTMRYSVKHFGIPWAPTSLYEPGAGVTMDSREYDAVTGTTYAALAAASRAQLRSFGFESPPWRDARNMQWRRIATRSDESAGAGGSIFAGVDTSFARLLHAGPSELLRPTATADTVRRQTVYQMPGLLAYADSARLKLDMNNPVAIVPYLKQVAELSSGARNMLRGCRHPARDAAMSISYQPCRPEWLDLDASLDLIQRRAADALLVASGVSVDVTSDREFLASFDTALVTVSVHNDGDSVIRVNDVTVSGSVPIRMTIPLVVQPHTSAHVFRQVVSIAYAHPYWIWKREKNFYPAVVTALDGVARPATFNDQFGIAASGVPENIRRLGDVTATITVGRTAITSSIGEAIFRTAEPLLGVRDRYLSGVPPVTLTFERALEWAQAGKPLKKPVRVIVRSYADAPITFALRAPGQPGLVKYDSLPPSITLAPHEAKEVTVGVRGQPQITRYDLPLVGVAGKDTFEVGFRTAQYSYLPPVHMFRESQLSVQSIDMKLPPRLAVAYIRGVGDDADVGLKQLGIPTYALNNEGLIRVDLDGMSTVVLGPDALRADPDLITQMPRLMDFVRKGGTLVILSNQAAATREGFLPFPVHFARPYVEQVTHTDAPVADARSRLMTWPNVITAGDWDNWVGARSLGVPTTVDPHYSTVLETHDPGQPENRNSVLVANLGKGKVVYTSLTLTQQISNGVPGGMRILVNLLSAGLQ